VGFNLFLTLNRGVKRAERTIFIFSYIIVEEKNRSRAREKGKQFF